MLTRLRLAYEKDWDEKKYWKRRNYVQTHHNDEWNIRLIIYLLLLRRLEAKKSSSTGLSKKGQCCHIDGPLVLYHGLCGIIIAPNTHIGKNVTIYQHATIAKDNPEKTTVIEDDVVIGAGAVIMKNVHIGKGAKIGAYAVVLRDVPENSIAIGVPARIILRDS